VALVRDRRAEERHNVVASLSRGGSPPLRPGRYARAM